MKNGSSLLFPSKHDSLISDTIHEEIVNTIPPIQQLSQLVLAQKQQLLIFAHQIFFQKHQLSLQFHQMRTLHIQQQLHQNGKETNQYNDLLLKDMASEFVNSFDSMKTRSTYSEGFSQLFLQGFLHPDMKLIDFSRLCGENLLDDVRKNYQMRNRKGQYENAAESTKQLRAAMLLAFSNFLQRRTEGFIKKITPNRFGFNKTFKHRRQKTVASHLTGEQLNFFLNQLRIITSKGFLFATLQILGAKRVSEVIQLRVEEVDIQNSRVLFRNLKQRGFIRAPVPIYIPSSICSELNSYIGERKEGFVFLKHVDENLPVTKSQITRLYKKAWDSIQSQIAFRPRMITHSLRAAGISHLYAQGIDSQLIKQITGHNSGDMIMYYNTSNFDNISKKICILDFIFLDA